MFIFVVNNVMYIPSVIDYDLLKSEIDKSANTHFKNLTVAYSNLMEKYTELSRLYQESLVKCIRYQDEIIELQGKCSKLQDNYIKLANYAIGDDKESEDINKIKIT